MKLQLFTVASAIALSGIVLAAEDERLERLSEDERAWLEQEVVYIISKPEREVFLNLATKEERERFVEAFWDRRDPNRATIENEFAEEHYRRLEYAIRVLGRDAPRPGWRTDRGKYYIILGEPTEIQRYDGSNEIVSTELWLYNGDTRYGLPARFNLMFFKDNDIGEYELYHPQMHGPERLLHDGFNYRTNQNIALDILETISADVARAAVTIDLSEPTAQMFSGRNTRDPMLLQIRPSMAVDANLADIEAYPIRKVDTDYLEGYLSYGSRVSSAYSFNFVGNRSLFAVVLGDGDVPFVHYSIELDPQHVSLEANDDETLFYTTLEVSLELRDEKGQLLAVADNARPVRLTRSQFDQASSRPFAYRDSFPVLPGDYRASVILRNRATKEYTVAEADISVPEPAGGTTIFNVIVASRVEPNSFAERVEPGPFTLGRVQIEPTTESLFALGTSAHVAAQVRNAEIGQRIRFSIVSDDERLVSRDAEVGSAGTAVVTSEIPLGSIQAGRYLLRSELLDAAGAVIASRDGALAISPRTSIPRPGVVLPYSFPADVPGLVAMTLGEQLMARGRIEEAELRLREAVEENPSLPMAKWKLASAILFRREADEALALLLPLEQAHADQVEVVEGIGFAHYIKADHARALPYLERARTLRPADTSLLNALGDCYQRLEKLDEAREAFELSLQINPTQEGVKARLAGLGAG